MSTIQKLATIGDIADRLRAPRHRVAYAIRSRDIKPVARIGGYRVFDSKAVSAVRSVLAGVAAGERTTSRLRDAKA